MTATVLCVAEKPSLATSIADILSDHQVLPASVLGCLVASYLSGCPGVHLACMQVHSRRGYQEVHEWTGRFLGGPAHFKMTSVIVCAPTGAVMCMCLRMLYADMPHAQGHVLSIDFPAKYQNWETTDPLSLFDAPTQKTEANPKASPDTPARSCA